MLRKLKYRDGAVSMLVMLILMAVIIPAVYFAVNRVDSGARSLADETKRDMPYMVLGPDYEKPIQYTEGFEGVDVNDIVVAPPVVALPNKLVETHYWSPASKTWSSGVFTVPETAYIEYTWYELNRDTLGYDAYPTTTNPSQAIPNGGQFTMDYPGQQNIKLRGKMEAVSVQSFLGENGEVITKKSAPAVFEHEINLKLNPEFQEVSKSANTNTDFIERKQSFNHYVESISNIYYKIDGVTKSFTPSQIASIPKFINRNMTTLFIDWSYFNLTSADKGKTIWIWATVKSSETGATASWGVPAAIPSTMFP